MDAALQRGRVDRSALSSYASHQSIARGDPCASLVWNQRIGSHAMLCHGTDLTSLISASPSAVRQRFVDVVYYMYTQAIDKWE